MSSLEENQNRLPYINIAKGIAIILIVVLHAISQNIAAEFLAMHVIRKFVLDVIVPLFFVTSGVLFSYNVSKYQKQSISTFILRKARVFLVPYVSVSIVVYLLYSFLGSVKPLAKLLASVGIQNGSLSEFILSIVTFENPVAEHLWFAYVMFFVVVLAYLVYVTGKKRVDARIFFFVLLAFYIITYLVHIPYMPRKVIRYSLYFFIGKLIQDTECMDRLNAKKIAFIVLVLVCTFSIYEIKFAEADSMLLLQSVLTLANGVLGSLLCLKLAIGMNNLPKLSSGISYCGVNSYPIYLYHQPFFVSGSVAVMVKCNLNPFIAVLGGVILGISIPLLLYQWIIAKNRILKLLFSGEH